jgi:hypothetical protein
MGVAAFRNGAVLLSPIKALKHLSLSRDAKAAAGFQRALHWAPIC